MPDYGLSLNGKLSGKQSIMKENNEHRQSGMHLSSEVPEENFIKVYINEENKFENYEGLSTFTYSLLCTNSKDEVKTRLLEYLDRIYTFQSYARTYGFINGALYAFLLYEKGFDFKTIKTDSIDISKQSENFMIFSCRRYAEM